MKMCYRSIVSAAVVVLLAACGGGGGHSPLPAVPTTSPSGAPAAVGKGTASFSIAVPVQTAASSRTPKYVSPATQSMTINITQGSTSVVSQTVSLTPTATGCTSTAASTTCTLQVSLNAGNYVANITTYDGTNGTGNQLSTAQGVAFTITASTTTQVPLTLTGIPAKLVPTIVSSTTMSAQMNVVAEDADGNYIIGAGAPTFSVQQGGGGSILTITQPTTAAPNAFSVAANGKEGTETVAIVANLPSSGVCTQTGAVCTVSFTASLPASLAVTSYNGSVYGFSVPFTSSNPPVSFTITGFDELYGGIAFDPTGNLYVNDTEQETSSPFTINRYNAAFAAPINGGSAYNISSGYLSAPGTSYALTAGNGYLFAGYGNEVIAYQLPLTSASATVTISSGISEAQGLALDASGDLFVANYSGDVTEYSAASGYTTLVSTISVPDSPYSVAFDKSGNLWVATYDGGAGEGGILEFESPNWTAGTVISTGIDSPDEPQSLTFDAAGNLWVLNATSANSGVAYKPPFSNSSAPALSLSSLDEPYAIAADSSGNVYVANSQGGTNEGSISQYSISSSSPAFTIKNGSFDYLYGLAVSKPASSLIITVPGV